MVHGLDDGLTKWVHSGTISSWIAQGGYEEVTGLTPNSEYRVEFLVNGQIYETIPVTTEAASSNPCENGGADADVGYSKTQTSITLEVYDIYATDGTGNVDNCNFDIYIDGVNELLTSVSRFWNNYNGEYTIDGLSPGTAYTIKIKVGKTVVYNKTITTDSGPINSPLVFQKVEIIYNLTSSTRIQMYPQVTFYNPNNNSVYGRCGLAIQPIYLDEQAPEDVITDNNLIWTENVWIPAKSEYTFSLTTVSATTAISNLPKDYVVGYNTGIYINAGATSGNMTLSGLDYHVFEAKNPGLTRPEKFYWIDSSTILTKGMVIKDYITANKWKTLQNNINAVRVYKGLNNYSFTAVASGQIIKATYYNELANAINEMLSSSSSYIIATVSEGDVIYAAIMNKLQNSINSIT